MPLQRQLVVSLLDVSLHDQDTKVALMDDHNR
jgi:hypothetical protein